MGIRFIEVKGFGSFRITGSLSLTESHPTIVDRVRSVSSRKPLVTQPCDSVNPVLLVK
jgi:hypothetical protein